MNFCPLNLKSGIVCSVQVGLFFCAWEPIVLDMAREAKATFLQGIYFCMKNSANPPYCNFLPCEAMVHTNDTGFLSPLQRGVFRLANEDYFIEPLATNKHEDGTAHPHRIYKRHAPEYKEEASIVETSRKQDRKQSNTLGTCGVQGIVSPLWQVHSESKGTRG